MSADEHWIYLSVFYDKKQWHQLLSDCIRPFVNSMNERKYLATYNISLNSERGSNIRLSLLSNSEHAQLFLHETDTFFNQYLLSFPSQSPKESLCSNPFFMNFYENHIYYNLYKQQAILFDESVKRIIYGQQESFSAMLIDVLGENIGDEETRFTLLIYSTWGVISAYADTVEKTSVYMETLLEFMTQQNKGVDNTFQTTIDYEDKFRQYLPSLLEIKKDIWSNSVNDDSLQWLRDWKTNCKENFTKFKHLVSFNIEKYGEGHNLELQFQRIIFDNIRKQLGLTKLAATCVFYFARKIIPL